jgi:exopolyphosphatase/guanosine-5'-triphosphate,3'-diphosphate pyrophosphatase
MKRIAVVDLGTNTCNLLIADCTMEEIVPVFTDRQPVKLGCEEGLKSGMICPEAISRTLEGLSRYKKAIVEYSVPQTNVLLIATAAVRGAKNKESFIQKIKVETGFDTRVIDGETEASLIYYGAKNDGVLGEVPSLIMDIGGGSTEFIIGTNEKILWQHSFVLGVSALLQELKPHDPMICADLRKTMSYLSRRLELLTSAVRKYKPKTLIGTSGAFKTLTNAILMHLHSIEKPPKSQYYKVSNEDFRVIYRELMISNLEQRLKMKGIEPYRAEFMPMSVLFIKFVMKKYNLKTLIRASSGIKEGAIIKYFCNES